MILFVLGINLILALFLGLQVVLEGAYSAISFFDDRTQLEFDFGHFVELILSSLHFLCHLTHFLLCQLFIAFNSDNLGLVF